MIAAATYRNWMLNWNSFWLYMPVKAGHVQQTQFCVFVSPLSLALHTAYRLQSFMNPKNLERSLAEIQTYFPGAIIELLCIIRP